MRLVAAPFVVAPPTGARIRTRLRPSKADERVLWAVGGTLAASPGRTWRCAAGLEQATTSAPPASAP